MNSLSGMRVVAGVLLVIALALGVELYRAKSVDRTPKDFEGILTSEPAGTQFPSKIHISDGAVTTTSPGKETYTVDPSIEYKDMTFRIDGLGVEGQILTGKLQRAQ